jgi:hypothetical protein
MNMIKTLYERSTPAMRILIAMIGAICLITVTFFLTSCQVFHTPTPVSTPSPVPTATTTTFRNPLNSSGPDPWMTYYNGNYYLAATTWGGASTGLTMRKASTIADLKSATPVRIWQDSTATRCCNYWAPEFFLLNGPDGLHWGDRQPAATISVCT